MYMSFYYCGLSKMIQDFKSHTAATVINLVSDVLVLHGRSWRVAWNFTHVLVMMLIKDVFNYNLCLRLLSLFGPDFC